MTTTALSSGPHHPRVTGGTRVRQVVRLQLINRQTFIWVPLIVLGGTYALTYAIFAVLKFNLVPAEILLHGGGAQAPLWYFLIVGIQALTLTFPFSQAMSVTRHEFYVGTLLTAALTSALLATIGVLGGWLELATNGLGINGYFFHLPWLWESGPAVAWFVYFVIALFMFVVGFWAATIYKRWGATWTTIVLLSVAAVLVAIAASFTVTESWPQVWSAIVNGGPLPLALVLLALTVVQAGVSYATLRRTVA